MDYYRAFPLYMGYQGYGQWAQQEFIPEYIPEDRILEDLEYLQQMYPTYAKRYQSVISSVVDKVDYEGSFIYDQYPDKYTIQRMVSSVMAIIRTNEEKENAGNSMGNTGNERMGDMRRSMPDGTMMPEGMMSPENMPDNTMMPEGMMSPGNMPDNAMMPDGMAGTGNMPGNSMPVQNVPNRNPVSDRTADTVLTERAPWSEKEPWIRELVTVLMYYEILARRRKKNAATQASLFRGGF